MASSLNIFGVRHHGPGSARSLLTALNEVRPDCLLVEGPPDANELIEHAARPDMKPPVAILVHATDKPSRSTYYPLADFSPEWQAMRWAIAHNAPVRFMDLPQFHRMAIEAATDDATEKRESTSEDPSATPHESPRPHDPLGSLAHAAGFDDGERWWEHVVEHRRDGGVGMFQAVRDAMSELRQSAAAPIEKDEAQREAWMRRTIREARSDGAQNIAVVCGAWHAPVLDPESVTKKQDDELLTGLPRIKTSCTWVPWTYDRLTYFSGYGAGVRSPGWYEHLWTRGEHVIEAWLTKVAHLLREKDIDCSSAHVIEAVRLCTTLATFRGRPLADLSDIADATRAVFFFDNDLPMRLIDRELLVGVHMGEVPGDTPMVPLQQDLTRLQKRLRLKPEALEKTIDLDLREETGRERSRLLHRLRLLGIDWGTIDTNAPGGKGTFHEFWQLRWDPAFAVMLIEAGALGNTIEDAAGAKLRQLARESNELRALAALLHDAMLADLGDASAELVRQIQNAAAVGADVALLMQTLPPLSRVLRYGNVRQTDEGMIIGIINGMVPRITVGLSGAVASLNDEAAVQMESNVRNTHEAIALINSAQHMNDWLDALARISEPDSVHGLIRGRATRLLQDANRIDVTDVARRLSLVLSRGTDPAHGARWLEGFLSGSGLLLIHDRRLLDVIDQWVDAIHPDLFKELVPLLRRTFATFPAPERRQIGQMIVAGSSATSSTSNAQTLDESIDHERAAKALPLLMQILGGAL